MTPPATIVPVVLFAYARPIHLARALTCLRENRVPLIYAFSDGAKGATDKSAVAEVRTVLRDIDWSEMRITERKKNLGLGANVLAGVGEIIGKHDAFIVWEDDLICVPGTYEWLCAALKTYADDQRVMSVTAWNHPRVIPSDVNTPYFDARAECWIWGAYSRSWRGMEETALQKMKACRRHGMSPDAYGDDLPEMARNETIANTWATRWIYHHLQHKGLCLRPPWSMVEHIGFDQTATNAAGATVWINPPLRGVPRSGGWPEVFENPQCRRLWYLANYRGKMSFGARIRRRLIVSARATLTAVAKKLLPVRCWSCIRQRLSWRWFRGRYTTWAHAQSASRGYHDVAVLERARAAARTVRAGRGLWERDGTVFETPWLHQPLLHALRLVAEADEGRLVIVDIGGAFGSTWLQHKHALADLNEVSWRVVEQRAFVSVGRSEFSDDTLAFHDSIPDACSDGKATVALLSSVLPYVQAPERLIADVKALRFRHVIVDRTPFSRVGGNRLVVQQVPPELGGGSYPCWIFDRARFLALFSDSYELVNEWPGFDNLDPDVEFRGYHFRQTEGSFSRE